MATATIKMFLAHGDPTRLRTAELSGWTGKAVAGPRSEFSDVLAREESDRSGVYMLTGTDPESGKSAIYIGEAENIRSRIKSHVEKDFWNQAVYFVSKDENLTKAHIRYLSKAGSSSSRAPLRGRWSRMVRVAERNFRNRTLRTWRCSWRRSANCCRFSASISSFPLLVPRQDRPQEPFSYARSGAIDREDTGSPVGSWF
jgi:hypothetical protein